MFSGIDRSASLNAFQKAICRGESLVLEELWDSAKALLAVLAVQAKGQSLLLITGGTREDSLFENISQIAPELVVEFPAWETLPGEEIAPSPDIVGKRMKTLQTLLAKKGPSIVLCSITSLLQKVPSKERIAPLFSTWQKGTNVPFDSIPKLLTGLGYKRADVVSDKGEFAIRGGIVDLFPAASNDPFRIDFFGDTIDTLRTFDPVGQKSIQKVESLFLSPVTETHPLASITDYLAAPFLVMWDDLLAIEDAYVALKSMPGAKSPHFFKLEELPCAKWQHIFCSSHKLEELSEEGAVEIATLRFEATRVFVPLRKVADYFDLELFEPEKELLLYFLNANETEEADVRRRFAKTRLPKTTHFVRGYMTSGFVVTDIPLAVIPNPELTQKTHIRRQKWRSAHHTPEAVFHKLSPGDLVVHFHSGIGKYLGVEKHTNHLGVATEFLSLEYSDKAKLFVPLSQAYLVSRYIGSGDELPKLTTLGSKRWQTVRQSAQAQIVGYANDLLKAYAERAAHGGFAYAPDSDLMRQFEGDFPYEETSDQLLAIGAIKQDMQSKNAMDRIICGDVGYGKTEVAMRAAFKAVVDGGKQVAVLVPTTVLAMQHYETFAKRMEGFPIRVGVASRFCTPKETKTVLEGVQNGQIDILVGTHRLLSKDVSFKNLGLLIIDEEQRFGVRAKEHLKKMKIGVDCLTLSATPIPRTLHMSLVGARDMSVISTPPQDRLPIKTILAETDNDLITNGLLREFSRGGQAFFIHNRVESIYSKGAAIQKLVPQARIGVVHGQMDADAVDTIFHAFKSGAIDLLFATTIVENGIDIPNANTIFIERADTYGLADLYQLRGRVGRWNRTAYAYFLIPKHSNLPEITQKRLNAIVESSGFGGGMKVAMRDLEIRGAGDILGVEQSGQVSTIGFHLYCKLLKRAIDAIKKQKAISFEETKLEFAYDARIPDSYIFESSLRMELYYRFGEATTFAEVDELMDEMRDRFGPPPEEVLWLYHIARIRTFASANHFALLHCKELLLTAEQKLGKGVEKKALRLPRKPGGPQELEACVIEQLKRNFRCSVGLG